MKYLFLLLAVLPFMGCEKTPGEGGTSTIAGRIWVQEYDEDGQPFGDLRWAIEERVYLIYGEGTTPHEDTRTSWDGTYHFNNLRQGTYIVFGFSDCDSCATGLQPVFDTIEITSNNQTFQADSLVLQKPIEVGAASVAGRIWVEERNDQGMMVGPSHWAQEERVYIIRGLGTTPFDDTRTSWDGSYQFNYLHQGTYIVFAYSDCAACPSGLQPVFDTVEVTSNYQTFFADTITVIR